MRFVSALLENDMYNRKRRRLDLLETDRIFCRHDMAHFMDVARIAQLRNLEEHMQQDKEMIYLYALLHDIGRVAEYEQGISHAQASADAAGEILMHLGYPAEQIVLLQKAILEHRGNSVEEHPYKAMESCDAPAKKSEDTAAEESADRVTWDDTEQNSQRFVRLMKWADKASRRCFDCKAYTQCKWSEEKKNKAENLVY